MSQCNVKIYRASAHDFKSIPGSLIAYWKSKKFIDTFKHQNLSKKIVTREGMATADNDKFLRYWYEVSINRIGFNINSIIESVNSNKRWFPYNKGGDTRKWYGNNEYIVNWENDGYDIKHNFDIKSGRLRSHNYNGEYSFCPSFNWTEISSSISVRYSYAGFLFDSKGASGFAKTKDDIYYVMGLLNSVVGLEYLKIFSPTMDIKVGDVIQIPYIENMTNDVLNIVEYCISASKLDWDSFETSWDFQTHPFLIHKGVTIEESYNKWDKFTVTQFSYLKSNEEKLNKMFIEIYGLDDELTPDETNEEVTIRIANMERDVKSFISYAVGCMFGRYSIDRNGLILASSGESVADYKKKVPESRYEIDDDNIIPILDDDYFHDDIVSRFKEFLKTVYGNDTLEENMSFIAHALSPSSSQAPDMVIRDYFLKDFYADHLKIYQKRPIYWMFTSGKEQGFNALIYMHRYNKDTIGKIWGDYLRELEAKLDAEISLIEKSGKKNSPRLLKLKKQRLELKEYDAELDIAASEKIDLNLDDGVVVNYAKFGKLLRQIK